MATFGKDYKPNLKDLSSLIYSETGINVNFSFRGLDGLNSDVYLFKVECDAFKDTKDFGLLSLKYNSGQLKPYNQFFYKTVKGENIWKCTWFVSFSVIGGKNTNITLFETLLNLNTGKIRLFTE